MKPETREKIRAAARNRKQSPETKAKIAASLKGNNNAAKFQVRLPAYFRTSKHQIPPASVPTDKLRRIILTAPQWMELEDLLRSPADGVEDFVITFPDDSPTALLWGFRTIRGMNPHAETREGVAMLRRRGQSPCKVEWVKFLTPDGAEHEISVMVALDPDSEAMSRKWRRNNPS